LINISELRAGSSSVSANLPSPSPPPSADALAASPQGLLLAATEFGSLGEDADQRPLNLASI
jgi:hypothetical protein